MDGMKARESRVDAMGQGSVRDHSMDGMGWDGTGWDTWDGMAEMGYDELDRMRQDGME